MIFHGNSSADGSEPDGRGLWTRLRPGHGAGFSSDGLTNGYSNRFGIELTFAAHMRQLCADANIAVIKYSRGGTSIDVENDTRAALVASTDSYGYSDPWHYDSEGYLDLGRRFAEALMALERH